MMKPVDAGLCSAADDSLLEAANRFMDAQL
jgi:hypothetical protein